MPTRLNKKFHLCIKLITSIPLFYLAFSLAWIIATNDCLLHYDLNFDLLKNISIRHGLLFVFSTFVFLFFLVREMHLHLTTLNSQLTKYSLFDQVTNLPNRYFVIDRIEQLIKSSKRVKTIFGVIFIDIDNFKVVNDTFGHAIADALLKEFGFIVSSSIRQTDTVGRIGGDEFLVILTDVTSEKDINIIMLKIKNALTQKLSARNGKELNITASMGTALFPRDGNTFEELLHHSDQNMYLEKKCSHTN